MRAHVYTSVMVHRRPFTEKSMCTTSACTRIRECVSGLVHIQAHTHAQHSNACGMEKNAYASGQRATSHSSVQDRLAPVPDSEQHTGVYITSHHTSAGIAREVGLAGQIGLQSEPHRRSARSRICDAADLPCRGAARSVGFHVGRWHQGQIVPAPVFLVERVALPDMQTRSLLSPEAATNADAAGFICMNNHVTTRSITCTASHTLRNRAGTAGRSVRHVTRPTKPVAGAAVVGADRMAAAGNNMIVAGNVAVAALHTSAQGTSRQPSIQPRGPGPTLRRPLINIREFTRTCRKVAEWLRQKIRGHTTCPGTP